MRVIFGIILGIALTLGAAFFHDNNLPSRTTAPTLTERPIVNWDVLGAVVDEKTAVLRRVWNDLTGG